VQISGYLIVFFFSFCNTSYNKYFMSAANTKKLEEKIS
jgi:hypothetical protein